MVPGETLSLGAIGTIGEPQSQESYNFCCPLLVAASCGKALAIKFVSNQAFLLQVLVATL